VLTKIVLKNMVLRSK